MGQIVPQMNSFVLSTTPLRVLLVNADRKYLQVENKDAAIDVLVMFGGAGSSPFPVDTDEVQDIGFSAVPSSGTFKLTHDGNETAAINWNDNAAAVQVALRALGSLSAVTVAGSFAAGFTVTFTGADGDQEQTLLIVSQNSLKNDTATADEVQTLTFSSAPDAGDFKLRYNGSETTGAIAFSDAAGDIQTALRALASLSAVTVAGTFAGGFVITFAGADGSQAQPLLEVVDNTLTDSAGSTDEVQEIDFAGTPSNIPLAGSFKLMFGALNTTALTYAATNADVQTALRALATLSAVTVAGSFSAGFTVTFTGADGNQDQTQLYVQENTLNREREEIRAVTSTTTPGSGPTSVTTGIVETTPGVADIDVDATVVETTPGVKALGEGTVIPATELKEWDVDTPIDEVWIKSASGTPIVEVTEG